METHPDGLTRTEAAAVTGVSVATIRRAQDSGTLEGKISGDGRTRYAAAALVAAGLLDPLPATGDVSGFAQRNVAEQQLSDARRKIELLETNLDAAETRIRDLTAQLDVCQTLLLKAAA